jgi:putative ABC transport system permease protein
VIIGTEGADEMDGQGGNDLICALGGDDVIAGGLGNDKIDAGPGNDDVVGDVSAGGSQAPGPDTGVTGDASGGGNDVIGRTLPLSRGPDSHVATIVGVMPEGFRFAYAADVWLAMHRNGRGNDVRHFHNWLLLGRLKTGVTLLQAQKEVDAISAALEKEYPDSNRTKALLITPLQEALAEGDRPNLLILFAALGVLLLVACTDIAALLLSRGSARQGEMAIRTALGATRARLVHQLLGESLLVAAAAGTCGVLVAYWLRTLVLRLVPLDALGVAELSTGGFVLAFAIGVTLLTSAVVGIVPALLGTRVNAVAELKSGTRTTDVRAGPSGQCRSTTSPCT